MIGPTLIFIVLVPVLIAFLLAFASMPPKITGKMVESTGEEGGNRIEWREADVDRFGWLADVGLDFQFAGLTTLVGAIIDRQATDIWGIGAILIYTIGMAFGLVRYREYRYWSVGAVPGIIKNLPFLAGAISMSIVEVSVVYWYFRF